MSKRLTEKLFWEIWPEVRHQFPSEGKLRTKEGRCPIIAVAHKLGMVSKDSTIWIALERCVPRSREEPHSVAKWVRVVANSADWGTGRRLNGFDEGVRRRLLEGG